MVLRVAFKFDLGVMFKWHVAIMTLNRVPFATVVVFFLILVPIKDGTHMYPREIVVPFTKIKPLFVSSLRAASVHLIGQERSL